MKKLILLVCFLLVSSMSYSQIFTEDFSYTSGTLLTSTAVWTAGSAPGTNALTVTAPGLTFPSYAGSGVGNACTIGTSGEDDSASYTRQDTGTTTSVYASFMLNVTAAQTNGDYFFALSTSGNAFDARVYAKTSGQGYVLGLTKSNEATVTYGSTVYNFGQTYLVVDKYTFISGTANDETRLYVFDTALPILEPGSATIGPVTSASADAVNLSRVLLRQGSAGNAPTVVIDGLNIDLTWNNSVLPVELASFTSTISNRDVTLNWSTASELNNSGFEIERSSNNEWTKVGNVNGNGTSSTVNNYSYTDRSLTTGSYSYRLKQVDFNGNFEYFNLNNEVNIGTPSAYALSQNYPNPFNPSTTINFDIPTDGNVSLKLYDMSGKEVATLLNEVRSAGYYSVNFNASQLTSGVYFYTIAADNFSATKKMLLVK